MKIVFDIETAGTDLEELPESQQEYLLRHSEGKIEDVKRYLSLYPFTAKIISIGMLNATTENLFVMFESETKEEWSSDDKKVRYSGMSETEMISSFWDYVSKSETIITFNGRNFDIPFLMLRSSVLGIKPTRNYLKNRYNNANHIDLQEMLTFYGTVKKFNLDFYCHSYGIESPKSDGITGMDVKEMYKAGKIKEIAIYCGKDVKATYELYKIWDKYLNL